MAKSAIEKALEKQNKANAKAEREAKKAAYGSEDSRASHRDNEEEKGGIFCAIRDFLDLMDFLDLLHGLR